MLNARLQRVLAWIIRGLTVLAVAMALAPLLEGCAALEPCPLPTALAMETPSGVIYLFDEENMGKLAQRLEGLKAGTCLGLPAPEDLPEGARPS